MSKHMHRIIIKQGSRRKDVLNPTYFEYTPLLKKLEYKPPTTPTKFKRVGIVPRLQLMFLPKDYPHSVTKEYLPYALYNFLNGISGTITGTLSMQALLQALGASASISIALSATTNWYSLTKHTIFY